MTFLFTDLEGSTRLWEELPDAMQDALARHDEILRDASREHGGQIVKTTGDGVHAVFAQRPRRARRRPRRAARARRRAAGTTTGPLRVRMGVHTGDAELRDGDYYGTAVNRAARLMAAAHGGQIVVSLATEELVRDALARRRRASSTSASTACRDLARARAGVPARRARARRRVPAAALARRVPRQPPPQLTSFVGREQSVVDIAGRAPRRPGS